MSHEKIVKLTTESGQNNQADEMQGIKISYTNKTSAK